MKWQATPAAGQARAWRPERWMHGGFRWTAATARSERIRAIIPNGRWLTAFASECPAVACQCHGVLARVLPRELVEAVERIVHLDVPHLREAGLASQLAQDRFGEAEGAEAFSAFGE